MTAAFTKPVRVARFGGTSAAETANSAEPAGGKKDHGWVLDDEPPSSTLNWLHYRYYKWARWLNERLFDGATVQDFTIKSPEPDTTADDGGDLLLEAGAAGSLADNNGGDVELSGGDATGDGSSKVSIKAATEGAAGVAARVAEDYLACDGSGGAEGLALFSKPVQVQLAAGSTETYAIYGNASGAAAARGVFAAGLVNNPVLPSLGINPQAHDPSSPSVGQVTSHSFSGHLAHHNSVAVPARFQNLDPLIKTLLADSDPVVNTAVEKIFEEGAVDILATIPADTLRVGSLIRVRAYGVSSNVTAATLTITIRMNGVAGVQLSVAPYADPGGDWVLDAEITIRTIGAGGTLMSSGWTAFDDTPTAGTWFLAARSGGAAGGKAINTTIANTIGVSATWNAANAANTATMTNFTVEVI